MSRWVDFKLGGVVKICMDTCFCMNAYLFGLIRCQSAASLRPRPSSSHSTTGSWLRSSRSESSDLWSSPARDVRTHHHSDASMHIPAWNDMSLLSCNIYKQVLLHLWRFYVSRISISYLKIRIVSACGMKLKRKQMFCKG